MDTGQETSVTMVAVAGACATIIMWLLGFYAAALMATAPRGLEAAITTILVGLVCYVAPAWKIGKQPPAP